MVFPSLLLPFSRIYGLILTVRNRLYDNGLKKQFRPAPFTIGVGNLTVGGTGKTPLIDYLIKRLITDVPPDTYPTATLSRGYGRRTRGFRIATTADTAATIGDEPLLLYRRHGRRVLVSVGERRADAIRHLMQQYPAVQQLLLDDAFQHRAVRPHLNLLLNDYNRPFYADQPFPAGRLREERAGAARADAVVVTKCPAALPADERALIEGRIRRYARADVPIFFAGLHYDLPRSFGTHEPLAGVRAVRLVSGLADADPLERYVAQTFDLQTHRRFADHYAYSRSDLDQLLGQLRPGETLLTTEKDWVKLDALLTADERQRLPLAYLPVAVAFLGDDGNQFDAFVDAVRRSHPA